MEETEQYGGRMKNEKRKTTTLKCLTLNEPKRRKKKKNKGPNKNNIFKND